MFQAISRRPEENVASELFSCTSRATFLPIRASREDLGTFRPSSPSLLSVSVIGYLVFLGTVPRDIKVYDEKIEELVGQGDTIHSLSYVFDALLSSRR